MKKLYIVLLCVLLSVMLNAMDKPSGRILKIDFASPVAERGGFGFTVNSGGLSVSNRTSLLNAELAIDAASSDRKIAMILLNTDNLAISGFGDLEELRSSLERFRESGKKVISYSTSYSNRSYYLASVADMVVFNPSGDVMINGIASIVLYYKDLYDRLGIEAQLIRHGKFKSAGEGYVSNEMSPENREQQEALLSSVWGVICSGISASRNISEKSFNTLVDTLALNDADDMLSCGLVDTLMYRDQLEEWLCSSFGVRRPSDIRMTTLPDYIKKLKKGPTNKKIAVIVADGSIAYDGPVGMDITRKIAKVKADSTVKAVVLRVNSPGGEVVTSDLIAREIETLRKVKPVIASYGDYAASGGYWISCGSDRIFTNNCTFTGSIGVYSLIRNYGGAIRDKLHINPVTVSPNKHGDISTMRALDDDELAYFQNSVENTYSQFVTRVSGHRGMTEEEVDELGQGRVWAGIDAIRNGLADERGTTMDAIKYAAGMAGIEKYRIVSFPEEESFLQSLLSKPEKHLIMARMPYDIIIE